MGEARCALRVMGWERKVGSSMHTNMPAMLGPLLLVGLFTKEPAFHLCGCSSGRPKMERLHGRSGRKGLTRPRDLT